MAGRVVDCLTQRRLSTFTATPATTSVPAIAAVPEPAPFEPMTAPPPPPPPYEEQAQDELAFSREPEIGIPAAEVSAWFGVRTGLQMQVVAHGLLAGGL